MDTQNNSFKAAIENFSDGSHDEALNIHKFDDQPSVPADIAAAERHFSPGNFSEREIAEGAPFKARIMKWGGGLAVAGVLAWAGATGGFDKDPEPHHLTTAEKQAVMNNAAEQQFIAEAQNH
ncbi:MAG: hypothetical protein U0524_01060 [Candidatus Saccharimonadales bacterium]